MARAAPPAVPIQAKPKGGGSLLWLLGVLCGAVLAFATPTAVLAGVLLAPAILTAVFDAQPKRPVTRVVLVSAAGFTFGPIWHLNVAGATMTAALEMAFDPAVLCPAWLAGACGWAVCEFLPLVLRMTADRQAAAKIGQLQEEAKALREEWDLEER